MENREENSYLESERKRKDGLLEYQMGVSNERDNEIASLEEKIREESKELEDEKEPQI